MLDLEPHGPLPPQIYWRRRGLALAVAVIVAGIVAAVVITVLTANAGADAKNSAKPANTFAAAAPPDPQPEVKSPLTPLPPPPVQAPTATAAVMPPPVLKDGDDCPDSTLAVKGITNQPQYVPGEQPKFTMVVTNIGVVACQRDVGAAVLAAYVYSLDNQRLWSNLDCAPSNESLVKKFSPGEQVTTEVTWTGMGSSPQCPLPRPPIGPGTYNLVVQLGNLRSAPLPFIIAQQPAQNQPAVQSQPGAPGQPVPGQPAPVQPPPG